MKTDCPHLIRFKHRALADLRTTLLARETRESFAILLAKREVFGKTVIFTVHDVRLPAPADYEGRGRAFLKMRKTFIHRTLTEARQRLDVDTLIDVHTHPFAQTETGFSSTDNRDESRFARWIAERFDGLYYGSVVFSQKRHQSRIWEHDANKELRPVRALLKTQTALEAILEVGTDDTAVESSALLAVDGTYNRSALALGLPAMRSIMRDQTVALAGVGGIGSVVAEHLVQNGFQRLVLVDPDRLDPSNMNRFVGASSRQAKENVLKVEAVCDHLLTLNPGVQIDICATSVEDETARELMATSDWIILSTDNHASRWATQRLALRSFVPMISAGVNITAKDGAIADMSGEVITVRAGDNWCLNCLGRSNLAKIVAESHPYRTVREQTVARGYVTGMTVKEPAVKTLNTIVASLAVDRLIDQYLPGRLDVPILVYENNRSRAIYEDRESLERRSRNCGHCSL